MLFFPSVLSPDGESKVDGKQAEINRVNHTLRGLKIPGGTKEIELYYELESF